MDSNTLTIIFIIFVAIAIAISTSQSAKTAKSKDEANQREAEAAKVRAEAERKQREEDEYFKKVDAVYLGCRKRKIVEWDSNESEIILVARNILNDSGLSERDIQSFFELGKERYEAAEREQRDAARRQECSMVQAEKARAEIIGKEKYYTNTLEQMQICEKLVNDWNERLKLRGQFIASAGMKPKTKSTVASATINSALFGTAAGVAAADRTRAQNEQAQATYDSLQNTLQETFSKPTDEDTKALRARGFLEELGYFKDTIDERVCSDDKETAKYFESLHVTVKGRKFSKSHKNLVATLEVEVDYPKFFKTYAIIDGSLRLVAKLNNKVIGDGFFCGDGFGRVCYTEELGFAGYLYAYTTMRNSNIHKSNKPCTFEADVLIQLHDDVELSTLRGVSIEVEPYHLWLLEGDDPVIEDEEEEEE